MILRHASLGEQYVVRFQDQSVVDRYHLRPDYPTETFTILNKLIKDEPRTVLDVGCGSGNVARHLAPLVERVDAVDISLPMLKRAKELPEGNASNIRWLHGRAEDIELDSPYALITAGQSLHWMDWSIVLPRFAQLLTPQGVLAIVNVLERSIPWRGSYLKIVKSFSNNPTYIPIDMITEFERHGLFTKIGQSVTKAVALQQTVEDYIAAQHARSACSLETMTPAQANQFDKQMHELLTPFARKGILTIQVIGNVIWGKPSASKDAVATRPSYSPGEGPGHS